MHEICDTEIAQCETKKNCVAKILHNVVHNANGPKAEPKSFERNSTHRIADKSREQPPWWRETLMRVVSRAQCLHMIDSYGNFEP